MTCVVFILIAIIDILFWKYLRTNQIKRTKEKKIFVYSDSASNLAW